VPILQLNGETLQLNGEDLYLNGTAEAPTVDSVVVSDGLITVPDVGGTFTVAVTFSEAMDTDYTPAVTFAPTVASTLTFSSGAWSGGDTIYTASYDIANGDIAVNGVSIDVTGGVDAGDGSSQEDYTPVPQFSINTVSTATEGGGIDAGGGGQGHSFTRERWGQLKKAILEAEERAEELKKKSQERVETAIEAATAVADVIEVSDTAIDDYRVDQLIGLLEGVASANTAAQAVKRANEALKAAQLALAEAEEEEEAIMLLMLH
jgi:hypothetical protein